MPNRREQALEVALRYALGHPRGMLEKRWSHRTWLRLVAEAGLTPTYKNGDSVSNKLNGLVDADGQRRDETLWLEWARGEEP